MLGDEKPYATFGTGRHFVTRPATAGMTGSVKIGDFKLSSDLYGMNNLPKKIIFQQALTILNAMNTLLFK